MTTFEEVCAALEQELYNPETATLEPPQEYIPSRKERGKKKPTLQEISEPPLRKRPQPKVITSKGVNRRRPEFKEKVTPITKMGTTVSPTTPSMVIKLPNGPEVTVPIGAR